MTSSSSTAPTCARTSSSTGRAARAPITSTEWAPTKRTQSVAIDHTGIDGVLIRTYGGGDRVLVRRTAELETIETGTGDDRIAVGDHAAFSGTGDALVTNHGGMLHSIDAKLVLRGGDGADALWFDDTGDPDRRPRAR